jgi:hypothetical protein
MSSIDEVKKFIVDIKIAILSKNIIFVSRKDKTKITFSKKMVIEELNRLTYENYHKGPEGDRNFSQGEVWVFGKEINSEQIYIKLKLQSKRGLSFIKIISFHPATYDMVLPFKK